MDANKDFLLLHQAQSASVRSLKVLTKKLEAAVTKLRLDPEDCTTLSFPQIGKTHYREPTFEGILTDDTHQLCRYIFVMKFVARSLEQPSGRDISEVVRSLHNINDVIASIFNRRRIKHVQPPVIHKEIEDKIDEETRHWVEIVLGHEHVHHIHAVRNYVLAKSLEVWLDSFGRDVRQLAEDARLIQTESAPLTSCEAASVYCRVTEVVYGDIVPPEHADTDRHTEEIFFRFEST